jgi:hypothetical protein
VENTVTLHRSDLLGLYYRFVRPTLPILEPRSAFEEALQNGMIPASLLAAVCAAAASFWSHSDTLQGVVPIDGHSLAEFVFSSTSLVLASIDDVTFDFRRNLLLRYQRVLNALAANLNFLPCRVHD